MPTNLIDPIKIFLKDPASNIQYECPIPPYTAQMPFMVIGWDGGGFEPDTHAGRAAMCYYILATSIPDFIEKIGKTPKWAGTEELMVQPATGKNFNANYNRRYLNFFFNWDDVRKKMVYAASAVDVVSHELGHALLDSIRPDFWNFAAPEVAALHESIGDIQGITTIMRHDRALTKALVETKGDLSRSNFLSRVGEEMGTALFKSPIGQVIPLRDAVNPFNYAEPHTLPAAAPLNELSTECHSLSRVFTRIIYEIVIGIYWKLIAQKLDGLEAIRKAGYIVSSYVYKAAMTAPAGVTMFANMGKALMFVDHQAGGEYSTLIAQVFAKRNLPIADRVSALSIDSGPHSVELKSVSETIDLSDFGVSSMSQNPLSDVVFHVPLDEYRRYDSRGNLVDEHVPDKNKTYSEIQTFANHLYKTGNVGDDKEFCIKNGVLVRNHISCSCRRLHGISTV